MKKIRIVGRDRVDFVDEKTVKKRITDRLEMVNERDKTNYFLCILGSDYFSIRSHGKDSRTYKDLKCGNLEEVYEFIKDL